MIETELEALIIHDLRNPLSGITGTIGLFSDGLLGPLTEEQQKYFANIKVSSQILANMLSDLGDISNLEDKTLQPESAVCKTTDVIAGIKWLIDSAAAEEKRVEITGAAVSLKADKELAVRILGNFLLNALRQIKKGEAVKVTIRPAGPLVRFEISDTGERVPEALRPQVFDKLFKVKHPELKVRAGRGLGFYFCKLAVAALGGQVGMSAESTFYFTLPAA